MMGDRLVHGINYERTQQRWLSIGFELRHEKALDMTLSLESAIIQVTVIQNGATEKS